MKRNKTAALTAIILAVSGLVILFTEGALGHRAQSNPATNSGKTAEQHFEKAITYLKLENFEDAISEYEKVVALSPESPIALDAKYWIGQSYFRMGKYDKAMAVFRNLLKEYPKSSIAPVAELMAARVEREKEAKKTASKRGPALDQKVIVDPETGVEFKKVKTITGKSDVIETAPKNALSPNGKFLLWERTVIPLDGGEPFDLVDKSVLRAVWAPDGKKAAFFSEDAIWIIPVSPETGRPTGPATKLLDGRYRFQEPVSWSPDSEKMAFMRLDDKNAGDIWTLSIKSGELTQVTDDPAIENRARWSPDGKTIAYCKADNGIWLVDADGENPRKLFDTKRARATASWSPDGQWILCGSKGFGLFNLLDRRLIDIKLPEGVGSFFSWSADGKKLLFYRLSYDFMVTLRVVSANGGPTFRLGRILEILPYDQFWSKDSQSIITTGPTDIWKIPLVGSEALPVSLDLPTEDELGRPNKFLLLSPGGKRVLFSVDRKDGKENLYTASFSFEKATAMKPALEILEGWERPVYYSEYSWSADGQKLAFTHQGNIWITSAEKIRPIQLTDNKEQEILPVISPDGKRIAYLATDVKDPRNMSLKVVSASGGDPKTIEAQCGRWAYAWSPDSQQLVFLSNDIVSVFTLPDGRFREILDFKREGLFRGRGFCWLPDGKHFAFISQKGSGAPSRIYVVSADSGQIAEIATDDDGWKDFLYPSPDGKWISYNSEGYVKTRPESSIWEVKVEDLLKGFEK